MASLVYNKFKTKSANGAIDLDTDDLRLLLVDSTTTADTEDDTEFIADLTTLGELSGTGYARYTFTSEAVNEDLPNNRAEFDAEDVVFSAIDAGTAQGAVIYKEGASDAAREVICYVEFTAPVVTNGGDFTIQWNAEGILQLT